jgi:hypothetical protein
MAKGFLLRRFPRVKGYVRENWGAPFILAFMALLIVVSVSLVEGLASLANDVAIWSYCSLVVGVILQFVCFLKYGKKGLVEVNESN